MITTDILPKGNYTRRHFNNFSERYSTWNYKGKNNNKYSAGILPYTYDNSGKILFLLGKDYEGEWSDFGGRSEIRDNNNEKNTASREFFEETLGSVMHISDCINIIDSSKTLKITSRTLNGAPYYMYIVFIDFVNYNESFHKTSNFIKYQFKDNYSKIIEKTTIRWFTIDTILNCIESITKPIPLRGVFYRTIQNCKEELLNIKNV